MAFDALSDVFRTVRLSGACFYGASARGKWAAEQPPRDEILAAVLPGADHLISYHVLTEGECYAYLIDGEPVHMVAGDVIVFTRGDAHVMASAPGMRAHPPPKGKVTEAAAGKLPFFFDYGDQQGPHARLVCGFLACDALPFNPLIDNLPTIIKAADPGGDRAGWLSQFLRFALTESADHRAGRDGVLARLSELMFIEVVRRHIEEMPTAESGWLAGLRDPFVGKAIALMHEKPAHDWTIDELAKEAGASRSVLAERFSDLVGMPPMHYLTKWRMQIASGLLMSGQNIARIAADTGYGSEAAFSRAFKKTVGVPPSAWRARNDAQASART